MFRSMKVLILSLLITSTALADADDWSYRHHHRHHHFGNNNYYYGPGVYLPPLGGYYPVPQQFYVPALPPVNLYEFAVPNPLSSHHHRDRW